VSYTSSLCQSACGPGTIKSGRQFLLAAPYAVVASAPLEGFLNRANEFDTLGDDEPETPCHLNK
jgi:hypothetical protein